MAALLWKSRVIYNPAHDWPVLPHSRKNRITHLSEDGSRTAVAEVRVAPNGHVTAKLLPAYIGSSGHPTLTG